MFDERGSMIVGFPCMHDEAVKLVGVSGLDMSQSAIKVIGSKCGKGCQVWGIG